LDAAAPGDEHEIDFPARRCDAVTDPLDLPSNTDAVYYLAQSSHYRSAQAGAGQVFAVNVAGALRAAEAAREAGARLFCYASTGSVYAPSFGPLSEDHPLRREEAYALSKVTAEEALGLLAGSMQVVRVRLFGVFGPGQRGMLVPSIVHKVQRGAPIYLQAHPEDPSDRSGLRISLSFVDDVARCLEQLAHLVIDNQEVPPVLNVAGPDPVSIRALAEGIGAVCGRSPVFEEADEPRRTDFVADISRLQALLTPSFTPFGDAIAATVHGAAPLRR
jgi:nucleoside-diphosphate-sugar epimerase